MRKHINWAPFVLGLHDFDVMHGQMFDEIENALERPGDNFPEAFDRIVELVSRDFEREEELMDSLTPSDRAAHCGQHARLLADLSQAADAMRRGDEEVGRRALVSLVDKLPLHVAVYDRQLAASLRTGCAISQNSDNPRPQSRGGE